MRYPTREIADIAFLDQLSVVSTPSAKFFWESERLTTPERGSAQSSAAAQDARP